MFTKYAFLITKYKTYTFCDSRTDENVLPLRPNRVLGEGVALAVRNEKNNLEIKSKDSTDVILIKKNSNTKTGSTILYIVCENIGRLEFT